MTGKYALFIWGSYGLSFAVLLWNVFAPRLRRNELKKRLSEALEDDGGEA